MYGMKQVTGRAGRPYLQVSVIIICILLVSNYPYGYLKNTYNEVEQSYKRLRQTTTQRGQRGPLTSDRYRDSFRPQATATEATQLPRCRFIKPKQDGLQYLLKPYTDINLTWPNINPKKIHRRLRLDTPRGQRRVQNCTYPLIDGVELTRSFERQLDDPVIRAIDRIQNPGDCSNVGYDVHVGHYAGLGSQLHVAGRRMLGANTNGRVFLLSHTTDKLLGSLFTANQSFCDASGVHGFECYFQTLSNCTAFGSSEVAERVEISGRKLTGNRERLAPLQDHPDFRSIIGNTKENIRMQRAYATEYMLRPNKHFKAELERMYATVFDAGIVPQKLISVNIRWGDKWSEMLLNPIEKYIDTVGDLIGLHYSKQEPVIVFLQTWEQDAHDHFKRLSPDTWDVRSFSFDRTLNPHNTEGVRSPNSTTISLCSMYIAADAVFHVGTRDSNWDRLIDELRITRGYHRRSSLMVDLSESGGDLKDNA